MPQEKQTTAVQWLMQQMLSNEFHNPYFEEALRLERQQIEDAVKFGQNNHSVSISADFQIAKDYYNDNFTQQQ
jgi:hypothetical protein